MEPKQIHRIILLNVLNFVMLTIIMLFHFFSGDNPVLLTGIMLLFWTIWVIKGNYNIIIQETDQLRTFKKEWEHIKRKNHTTGTIEILISVIKTNHESILLKQEFFEAQPENIKAAYQLILEKSIKHLSSAIGFLKQYDFIRHPHPEYLVRIKNASTELVNKLQELSTDCFLIEDQASNVDISVIDDLLAALKDMQDE